MRGSPYLRSFVGNRCGIIPAHAGLTLTRRATCSLSRDHPRACGAHYRANIGFRGQKGSSPRMRGSRRDVDLAVARDRIIPAHAGLTGTMTWTIWRSRDHPRACGAHLTRCPTARRNTGSSPRMRGSRTRRRPVIEQQRIIPAHAGLTPSCIELGLRIWDHPRACGAH